MRTKKTKEEIQAAARARQARFFSQKIKVQVYLSLRLTQKLDKECELRQKGRGEIIRSLVDSLPD